jgi:hypothetical protein
MSEQLTSHSKPSSEATRPRELAPDEYFRTPPAQSSANAATAAMALKSPEKFTDFIFADNDIRPRDEADFFLTLDTDIACCMAECHDMRSWANPRAFHLPLARVRRKVLETIEPPYFAKPLRADGLSYESCECIYFLKRALEKDFTASHAGWCNHDSAGSHGH